MKKLLFLLLMISVRNDSFATCVTPILPARPYIYVGGYTTLTNATGAGIWSSTNTKIASIGSATGIVKGIATGSCTISYHVGSCYYTKAITVYKDHPTVLSMGSNGYVTIDGQNKERGYFQSVYTISGSDTLLGMDFAGPLPQPFIYPKKANAYLDGDNSNNYFASEAALKTWMNANFEQIIPGTDSATFATKHHADSIAALIPNSSQFVFTAGANPSLEIKALDGNSSIKFNIAEGAGSSDIDYIFNGYHHRVNFVEVFHGTAKASFPGSGTYTVGQKSEAIQFANFYGNGTGATSTFTFGVPSGTVICHAQSLDASVAVATGCSVSGTTMTITTVADPGVGTGNVGFSVFYK